MRSLLIHHVGARLLHVIIGCAVCCTVLATVCTAGWLVALAVVCWFVWFLRRPGLCLVELRRGSSGWKLRWFGPFYSAFDNAVIALGECVAPVVVVQSRGEASDVDGLPHPSTVPIGVMCENLYIQVAEVMLRISCMLHYSRLVLPWR